MTSIIPAIIALLGQLIPVIGTASPLVVQILNTLVAVVPVLVKEYIDLLPAVKNIIAALKADPATTAEQMAALEALDQQVDQAFEAAATAAQAEDDAAG